MYEVTAEDIREAAFGIDIPAGTEVDAQLNKLIAKAEQRLSATPGLATLAARVQSGAVHMETVQGVVEDMVLRVVKNPRSLRSLGIDDFQATIDNSVSSGLLHVTGAELAMLLPAQNRSRRSIRMGVPSWRLPGA